MSGENPYIEQPKAQRPEKSFQVRFLPADVVAEVTPENWPDGGDGLPGSLLQIAQASGLHVDHACGGVCACATCHIIIREGSSSLPESLEAEEDMLDSAPGLTLDSRLSCQAIPDGSCDLVVEVPSWNRNLVSEDEA